MACYAGFEFPDDVPSGLIPDASLGSTVEGHEIRRGAASEGQEEVAAETLVVADVLESASERMENNAMEREDVSSAAALAGAGHPAAQIVRSRSYSVTGYCAQSGRLVTNDAFCMRAV